MSVNNDLILTGRIGSEAWSRDDRMLASLLRRAIVSGQARIVTTTGGRWWLQVDRLSVSRNEGDAIDRLTRLTGHVAEQIDDDGRTWCPECQRFVRDKTGTHGARVHGRT